jgi:predicted metal-dependent hydrolase
VTTSELVFRGGGHVRALTIVRVPRIRTMRLSIDPRDACVRLALPPRSSLRQATDWAQDKRAWIESELAKLPVPKPIVPGMMFLMAGDPVVLDWDAGFPRSPRSLPGIIRVGGPRDQLALRVLRFLKREALMLLENETRTLAAAHDIAVAKIGIGDARSRWGSCASSGDIRYSWRLILAPAFVRRATVAHEVAHRVHMNHSAAFHALAATLYGSDPAPARRWLRANGAALHWFGRDG